LDAKEAGFEIWCDPRIRVGHEKTRVIWCLTNVIIFFVKEDEFIQVSQKKNISM
jgi:hypothetical protein